jgi:hypothetical protein
METVLFREATFDTGKVVLNYAEGLASGIFSINRGSHQETVQDAPRFNSLARSSMI